MTPHTCEQAERAFGKRVPGCPRCLELSQGAAPRTGWQGRYFEQKAKEEAVRRVYDRRGLCACGKGGGHYEVCTAGQW
jgi:hypothetical protein